MSTVGQGEGGLFQGSWAGGLDRGLEVEVDTYFLPLVIL